MVYALWAKLDYQIRANMTAFLRFSQRKDISFFGPADPGPSGGDANGFIHAIQQQAAIGYTWAVSSTSLFEFRFGFHVERQDPFAERVGHLLAGLADARKNDLVSRDAGSARPA